MSGDSGFTEIKRVPDAVAPPPGNPRFPLFDGLRAVAAISVLAFHIAIWSQQTRVGIRGAALSQLTFGVTIFFLISGFLLYRPFVAARYRAAPRPSALSFAKRRVLRIVPAYWLALSVLAIYPGLHGVFSHRWWVYYFFAQDYSKATSFGGLSPAWSIGTEVTFYAFLPIYAIGLRRLSQRPSLRNELVPLLVLSVASFFVRYLFYGGDSSVIGLTLLGTFDWFAAGMALAVLSADLQHTAREEPRFVTLARSRPSACWLGAAAAWGVATLWFHHTLPGVGRSPYSAGPLHLIYASLAFLLLLPAVFDGAHGLPRRFLASRSIAWIGLVSYGIYLWHVPIIKRLATAFGDHQFSVARTAVFGLTATAISILLAALSYYVVERPILRLKEKRW